MAFDLFQSRNHNHELCKWWSRNESEEYEDNELVYKRVPSGTFYAREVNAQTDSDNILGGVFMADRSNVTITSSDDLETLSGHYVMKNEVLVEYQGEHWRVTDVQKRKARNQNSEFANAKSVSYYWYLSLVK